MRTDDGRPQGETVLPEGANFGKYTEAVAAWARTRGIDPPAPTQPTGRNGAEQLSVAFVEWMMGLPPGWVSDVPGVSRLAKLKALGNGVVPQQAAAALVHLLDIRRRSLAHVPMAA